MKFFLLFLFYASLYFMQFFFSSITIAVGMSIQVYKSEDITSEQFSWPFPESYVASISNAALLIIACILAFMAFFLAFFWLVKECLLIKSNRSFIDKTEVRKEAYEMEKQLSTKMYNKELEWEAKKGLCTKLSEVFGSWNVLLWPFPIYLLQKKNTYIEKELA